MRRVAVAVAMVAAAAAAEAPAVVLPAGARAARASSMRTFRMPDLAHSRRSAVVSDIMGKTRAKQRKR